MDARHRGQFVFFVGRSCLAKLIDLVGSLDLSVRSASIVAHADISVEFNSIHGLSSCSHVLIACGWNYFAGAKHLAHLLKFVGS